MATNTTFQQTTLLGRQIVRERNWYRTCLTVVIPQEPHPATRLVGSFLGEGKIDHFSHVHISVFVISHRDWAGNERLLSDEIHAKAIRHVKSPDRFARLFGKDARYDLVG
jgi:hypothetical protein